MGAPIQIFDMGETFEQPWTVISVYTRAQAIADGELVDVTEQARETGFRFPVALTRAVWHRIETIPTDRQGLESIEGRLHDLLWMLYLAIRRQKDSSTIRFAYLMTEPGYPKTEDGEPEVEECKVFLKAVVGPGDNAEPVITVMEPQED